VQLKILQSVKAKSDGVRIEEAERIVAVGMGAEDAKAVEMIKELAELLDAEVGGSRLAVEAGYISHDCQVGQTGKTVRPDLYVGCGISGAVQHTAGMSGAKVIVAINRDPEAKIFNVADYGIVGEVNKIVPALIKELKTAKG